MGLERVFPVILRFRRLAVALNLALMVSMALAFGSLAEHALRLIGINSFEPEVYVYIATALLIISLDALDKILATITGIATTASVPSIIQELVEDLTDEKKEQVKAALPRMEAASDTAEQGIAPFTRPLMMLLVAISYILATSLTTEQTIAVVERLPSWVEENPLTTGSTIAAILWSLRNPVNARLLIGEGKMRDFAISASKKLAVILYGLMPLIVIICALLISCS